MKDEESMGYAAGLIIGLMLFFSFLGAVINDSIACSIVFSGVCISLSIEYLVKKGK